MSSGYGQALKDRQKKQQQQQPSDPLSSASGSQQQQQYRRQRHGGSRRPGQPAPTTLSDQGVDIETNTTAASGNYIVPQQPQQQLIQSSMSTRSPPTRRSRSSSYHLPQTEEVNDDTSTAIASAAVLTLPWDAVTRKSSDTATTDDLQRQSQQQQQQYRSIKQIGIGSYSDDRRKQFDTTTPTLIDEDEGGVVDEYEDDTEMLQLQQRSTGSTYEMGQGNQNNIIDSELRRTPGASMYKSILGDISAATPAGTNTNNDDDAILFVRRTPGASAMHRSGPPGLGTAAVAATSATIATSLGSTSGSGGATVDETLGLSEGLNFGLQGLHKSLDSSGDYSSPSPGRDQKNQKQQLSWDAYQTTMQSQDEVESIQRRIVGGSTGSPTRQQSESRGLFSFDSWSATTKRPDVETTGATGRTNTGAFSPNILRLTEAIGNLLQEDEDDEYALDLPIAFRDGADTSAGSGLNITNNADFDWTGSYVFDPDYRRKPAVPTRSAVGSEKAARRRGSGDVPDPTIHNSQPPDGVSTPAQNTLQPKPRRNEAFDFHRPTRMTPSDERESPQLLIFGGAFAPPVSNMIAGGYMRPVASLHGQEASMGIATFRSDAMSPGLSMDRPELYGHQTDSINYTDLQQHQQQQQSGGFSYSGSLTSNPSYREHSLSYESYQSMNHPPGLADGSYMQNDYRASSPSYELYGHNMQSASTSQQSEMQATARVFIPNNTRSATPTYSGQLPRHPQQWLHPPGVMVAPPYHLSSEQFGWPANSGYSYGSVGYGYGMPIVQPQNQGEIHVGVSPSPIPPTWQQHVLHRNIDPPSSRATAQHHVRSASVPTVTEMTSPSPHPSVAGSEHSGTTTQRVGAGRKETKRKQRLKKKTQKQEAPAVSSNKPAAQHKKKIESSRPESTTQSVENDDARVSPADDPRRLELVESAATRIAFKEFYRTFRGEERLSFQRAEEFARKALQDESLPEGVHWRVYLELADLAKRSNRYVEARCLYQKVCEIQPYASQGWLEYSKLEEECGRMNRVMNILHQGLQYCEFSENLLTRAVKHHEKMGNLDGARGLLAKLKHVGIEKVWRTVLEGALLEARAGNIPTARRVLKYLMHHVPWYGPLYLEAYRLEKDQGNTVDALAIVERGLQAIPRYGPLWFGAFRLCEELDVSRNEFELTTTIAMIERAARHISKELVWKVHLDAAQMLERSAFERASVADPVYSSLLQQARQRLAMTILTSPTNLRWKVWLAAGRMELELGNTAQARSLFTRAHEAVSEKGRSSTLLECARLEDFVGNTGLARAILCKGRFLYGSDWKVWLESILLEMRVGDQLRSTELCEYALEIHQGTGRLWAMLVHLRQFNGRDAAQQVALRRALNAVPKSGEVWCEGGRIHLNPFSDTFDLDIARRHLHFATRFTPQYGDGFVETIRLELLRQWIAPIATHVWEKTKHGFKYILGGAFEDGLTKYVTDVSLAISVAVKPKESVVSTVTSQKLLYSEIVDVVRDQLKPEFMQSTINLNDVRLACINADPNYGLLWFHCRKRATDTPRRIIEDATTIISEELRNYAHLYLAAMIRREAILSSVEMEKPASLCSGDIEVNDPLAIQWEDYINAKLHASPSLETIFNPTDPTTGLELLESTARGPLFATGLTKLNIRQPIERMTLSDRRKALFGIDALFQ